MDREFTIGVVIILCALGFITYLTVWSRATIKMLDGKKLSLRDIIKKLHGRR